MLLGIVAAWNRGRKSDYAATSFTMTTYSMPDFWLGMLLLVGFAVTLGWFPIGGYTDPGAPDAGIGHALDVLQHLFLPALTLTLAYLGEYTLIMRSSLLDTMREDYLALARAKGLRDVIVRRKHAVPNALLPVITLVAINLGFVLSGAITVETVYSWPGLGLLTYQALNAPDLPLLQGLFLVFSASVIFFNFIADLAYAYFDPRVRTVVSSSRSSARSIAWRRRHRAFGKAVSDFRSSVPGMIGLCVLAVFVLEAILAPLLADYSEARAATADNPVWETPSEYPILGTDYLGRSVWAQFVYGARVSLMVGLAATVIAIVIGSVVGIVAGHYSGVLRRRADARHRVVPRDPVPASRDRAGDDPRRVDRQHHHRHRDHVLARHRAARAGAGADAEGASLRRTKPGLRSRQRSHHGPAHPAERLAVDPGQPDTHGSRSRSSPRRRWRSSVSAIRCDRRGARCSMTRSRPAR